ncbi:flagellar hook-associated protein FlgK [Nitrospira moscoviensis]|uniref:Flagellar hook-associated protein 1 n=1 Tax=Nitrospira moscoviensis TaxID=42253 RepID=A0A0K2GCB9_NITMO|nr:flagellar hook-associated protein FlgK [Nitrospira moscoviensis]ALA58593.1 First flagellar hook-filament junction protein FlgK (modular protein) [Nitrospira moscoviensis]
MIGLTSLFDIARSALTTSQQALAVTGHNVANVNTPGYSRQEAVLTERPPLNSQPGMAGTGVRATAIRRYTDQFVNRQLTTVQQNLGRLTVSREELFRLQNLFGDSNNQGIAARLNDFFRGVQDVSTNPGELAARSVLLANARQLASGVNQAASDLATARQSLNLQVQQTVAEINSLSNQIAELNGKIVMAEVAGQNANDLRDQRELALNELATRVDITTVESGTGALTVFAARGQVLVEGATVRQLNAVEDPENDGLFSIGYSTGGTRPLSIDALISNGRLRSLLDVRDTTVRDLEASFDRLAATLANAVNIIHRQGYGLDGSTGLNVFGPPAVTTRPVTANQGAAAIGGGAITANSLLTFHDYEIRFSSATAYSIVDVTTGATIRGNYTGTAITALSADNPLSLVTGTNDTLTVSVDGVASGTITLAGAVSPGLSYTSGAALAQEVQAKINADAALQAAGKTVAVTYDTTTSRLVITSNNTTTASAVDVTGGTARASLGLTGGTATAASGTYTSPATLAFDGLSVTLTGAPAAGDRFEVDAYSHAARDLAVTLTNPASVATSSTRTGIPGNNANLLSLVALQHRQFASLNNGTLNDAYRTAAAGLGVAAQTADREQEAQAILKDQIDTLRAQVSGVSIDEELVNLIKFQRGFEAASRLVRITDEMFQTLLSIKP